jgi:hypothetical protein
VVFRARAGGVWLRSGAEQRRDRSARLYAMSMNLLDSIILLYDAGLRRAAAVGVGHASVTTRGVADGPRTQGSSMPTCLDAQSDCGGA